MWVSQSNFVNLLAPESRLGDKPIKFRVVCPQNGTAVLKVNDTDTALYFVLSRAVKSRIPQVGIPILDYVMVLFRLAKLPPSFMKDAPSVHDQACWIINSVFDDPKDVDYNPTRGFIGTKKTFWTM